MLPSPLVSNVSKTSRYRAMGSASRSYVTPMPTSITLVTNSVYEMTPSPSLSNSDR